MILAREFSLLWRAFANFGGTSRGRVQPLDMVDNSTSPRAPIPGWFYPHSTLQIGCFIL